jgi:hypothetical protein
MMGGATALGLVACGRGARQATPIASLASRPEAARAFGPLHDQWEQRRLDPAQLAAFVRRFPDDGLVPLVRVYLAFALLEAGDTIQADGILSSISDIAPGSTRDLVTVGRARSLRLHGAPQSALELMRPLVGKVVDDTDREVFLEELALCAVASHDDYEALAYMDAWLRGSGDDDKDRVRAKVGQILETLPRQVLEQTYRTMRTRAVASGYGPDTQRLVAARLARIAVETDDAALARWLVESSGTSAAQAGGDAGLELGELAASRRGLSIVTGRTIGLLLPTRSRGLRDEAADVVRGLAWALDLPRGPGADGGLRLVTREDGIDRASTRAAIEELAGEGASVILAGFDHAGAGRVAAWSEESGLPVLLLAAPGAEHLRKPSVFVLGERPERELVMLADALARAGSKAAALVADGAEEEAAANATDGRGVPLLPPVRCDVPLTEAGRPRFPVDAWISSGADGWLVAGPSGCARDVLRDVARGLARVRVRSGHEPSVALTLEAGIPLQDIPRGLAVLSASAGLVPVLAARPEDAPDPDVRAFMEQLGVRPSYWSALGRDAGAIARSAISVLPLDSTTNLDAVAQRRGVLRAGLLGTRVKLWTTDARGFGDDRVLGRALRVLRWKAP